MPLNPTAARRNTPSSNNINTTGHQQHNELSSNEKPKKVGRPFENMIHPNLHATSPPKIQPSHSGVWYRAKNAVFSASSSKLLLVSSSKSISALDSSGLLQSPTSITRKEFETLPPTIQRKHFSTLERLCLARDLGPNGHSSTTPSSYKLGPHLPTRAATAPLESQNASNRPPISPTSPIGSKSLDLESRHRPRFTSLDQQLYTILPDKIKRRHLSEDEQLIATHQQFIDRNRPRSVSSNHSSPEKDPKMPFHEGGAGQAAQLNTHGEPDSFYDSFRWLEKDDGLDLRLCLNDYHKKLQQPKPPVNRRPTFRHQFSKTKLSFTRPDIAPSRPGTNDTTAPPSLRSAPSPVPTTNGHTRRKSRALSLISLNRPLPEASPTIDPTAAHFQDPKARLKLEYLSSPQKFDEAIQFGFPSVDEGLAARSRQTDDPLDQLRTFLEDDNASAYSDNSTIVDLDSPKTPPIMDRSMPLQPLRVCTDPLMTLQGDYAQVPMREMTLRMTLTRPDLRATEDDIYGWQKSAADRKVHMRGDSLAPIKSLREMTPKASIEQQFAAMDKENFNPHDDGALKRLWKRVRRA